eukprot:TRINITY_DN1315_c0_g4_i1.p1 TRINITY_DN1315_c0_g4~~TRINITY_DN1315_c0_g4_i1.p1  ORF type:complete len:211 (+),score=36.11 TRINITY_DN1315_c0_g4_i1:540-1172(+)
MYLLSLIPLIFSNPGVVKVFHGAYNDVLWLQRDFGIYVVNMFDTFQGAKLLSLKGCSLAFLLKEFCNVVPEKKYQTADWRARPLPKEMLAYAACDTHYLLEVFDRMNTRLTDLGHLKSPSEPHRFLHKVFDNSRRTCEELYAKPLLKSEGYWRIIDNNRLLLKKGEMSVLKGLLKWRDYVGRVEDESVQCVCPNEVLFALVRSLPVSVVC